LNELSYTKVCGQFHNPANLPFLNMAQGGYVASSVDPDDESIPFCESNPDSTVQPLPNRYTTWAIPAPG
jgi:hypothetical protein